METGQREELARWAETLEQAGDDTARAAGRAIDALLEGQPAASDRKEIERFATGLARSERPELRAAGRAIRGLLGAQSRAPRTFTFPWRRSLVVGGTAVFVAASFAVASRAAAPDLAADGPDEGALIGPTELATLSFSSAATGAQWLLDGRPVQARREGKTTVFRPSDLAEGPHELVIRLDGRLFSSTERRFRFTVDTTAPELGAAGPAVVSAGEPLVFRGTLEPGARLELGDEVVPLDDGGAFEIRREKPPRRLELVATDAAGNESRWRVPVSIAPRRPVQPLRAVHVTAYGWADDDLRAGVMALVRAKKINAIELDLKDESGEIGWASGVPYAKRIGAQFAIYDLKATVDELHALGIRVIGRLVCFRDPIHAQAAWEAGRRKEVVQSGDGGLYAGYGGFTNFANPVVRKYNIDLAVAAAKLGVDEILYDYVRRPDGPLDSMRFPGLKGKAEASIASFLAESRAALAGTGALLGASVFGVAASRPGDVAQHIPSMARHVDYVAPMPYPSHWAPNEYEVADPNGQPYEIVLRATRHFQKQVRGTGARVVNWIQDFSYGRDYGPEEVRAQIDASRDAGVDDFILWDAAVTYTDDALDPTAQVPALETTTKPPADAPLPVRLPDV